MSSEYSAERLRFPGGREIAKVSSFHVSTYQNIGNTGVVQVTLIPGIFDPVLPSSITKIDVLRVYFSELNFNCAGGGIEGASVLLSSGTTWAGTGDKGYWVDVNINDVIQFQTSLGGNNNSCSGGNNGGGRWVIVAEVKI